jgi:hypothetical protein
MPGKRRISTVGSASADPAERAGEPRGDSAPAVLQLGSPPVGVMVGGDGQDLDGGPVCQVIWGGNRARVLGHRAHGFLRVGEEGSAKGFVDMMANAGFNAQARVDDCSMAMTAGGPKALVRAGDRAVAMTKDRGTAMAGKSSVAVAWDGPHGQPAHAQAGRGGVLVFFCTGADGEVHSIVGLVEPDGPYKANTLYRVDNGKIEPVPPDAKPGVSARSSSASPRSRRSGK